MIGVEESGLFYRQRDSRISNLGGSDGQQNAVDVFEQNGAGFLESKLKSLRVQIEMRIVWTYGDPVDAIGIGRDDLYFAHERVVRRVDIQDRIRVELEHDIKDTVLDNVLETHTRANTAFKTSNRTVKTVKRTATH